MGVVSLVVTPLYLHLLGPEGFGLVGCYLLAQAILGFASSGLADAANREAARAQRAGPGGGALHGYAVVAAVILFLKPKDYDAHDVEVSGLYWHFVDLVWMFIFPLVYLMSTRVV